MSLRSTFQPPLASLITSRRTRAARRTLAELGRRLRRQPRRARVYLRLDDPYSFILAQILAELTARFAIELELVPMRALQKDMYPDRARLAAWARVDAQRLAALYDLEAPTETAVASDEAQLAFAEATTRGVADTLAIMGAHWRGETLEPATDPDGANDSLSRGDARLEKDGHYLAATIHYGGEWYWGIDRINHLETRWIEQGLARDAADEPRYVRRLRFLEEGRATPATSDLIFYWSARSPYAYLAIERAIELAAHHGVALDIRPVLPMVMRNLSVPRTKRFYILLDAKREADLLGVPLGRVCDPLGVGIERCYAILSLARERGRATDWVQAFATAVWSAGVDAATDRGIVRIAEAAGLDPAECLAQLGDSSWRDEVERNRQDMLAAGFWGVPTLVYGDTAVWGQDRFWVLEEAMRADSA